MQQASPSVVQAIASVNKAQKAQQSGDVFAFDLAVRELKLAAKQHSMQLQKKHDKEIEKLRADLLESDNKLKEAIATRTIRDKAQAAYESGNTVLGDVYMGLLSGKGRPEEIQRYEYRKDLGKMSEEESQLADRYLDPNYTPSALDQLRLSREQGLDTRTESRLFGDLTDEEKNVQLLQDLVDAGIITPEEMQEFIAQEFGRRAPTPIQPTDEMQNQSIIDGMLQRGEITQEEATELRKGMLVRPQSGSTSDAARYAETLAKYPAFTPNRNALDRLTQTAGKDKGQRIAANLDAQFNGRTFEQIPDNEKALIAKNMGYLALIDPPGGDLVKRFNFAQNLLKDNIPAILEQYEKVRGKLGRFTQSEEGIFKFLGKTADPQVARFQAILSRLVSDYVVLRSGAQITDREFQRYLGTLPSIGQEAEVNDEVMNAMIISLQTYFSSYFGNALGAEWGQIATQQAMGGIVTPSSGTAPESGRYTPEEQAFIERAKAEGYTDKEIEAYLKQKRNE